MGQFPIVVPWSDTGAITDPGAVKNAAGWIAEIPTHQNFNWLLNRSDQAVSFNQSAGLEPWHTLIIYADNGFTVGSDAVVYQSQQGANLNHQPVGDDGTWWLPYEIAGGMRANISGLLTDVQAASSNIIIGPGECRDFTDAFWMRQSGTHTKDISAAWTLTAGGRASADTWADPYFAYFYAIGKSDGSGDINFGADQSATATNLLSDASGDGFDRYRQIGFVVRRGSANLIEYENLQNDPDFFAARIPYEEIQAGLNAGQVLRDLDVPVGVQHIGSNNLQVNFGAAGPFYATLGSRSVTSTPSVTNHNARFFFDVTGTEGFNWVLPQVVVAGSATLQGAMWVGTNTAAGAMDWNVANLGFRWNRGL